MKFLIQVVLIAILTWLAQLIGPWWVVFIAAALGGMIIKNKGVVSFFAGFLGVALLWYAQALFIDIANESILSSRVAQLFSMNSSMLLILVTSLIGGICGGFGSLTGNQFVKIFEKKKERHTVYS